MANALPTTNSLANRVVRQVYLITYSQVDVEKCPTRHSFVSLVVGVFSLCNIEILHWVCCKEKHQEAGFHYHMAVKLKERRRWLLVRKMLQDRYGVKVNFSNNHDNYFTAWRYTTKEDREFIQSDNHPDLNNSEPPQTAQATHQRRARGSGKASKAPKSRRKRQLSVYEVSQIIVMKSIKSRLQLFALAQEQQCEGKTDLAQFILNRGTKVVDEAIRVAWELEEAPQLLQRSRQSRLERLQSACNGDCVSDCNKKWLVLARNILARNNIDPEEFSGAVRLLLEKGRGKYRNILITGASNCGKTFILSPLNVLYHTFQNPASSTFAWLSVESSEVIFLNDFRWSTQILPWHNFLLLLEGQLVRFPAPKTHYSQDIVFNRDSPIFCTSNEHFSFVRGGAVDQVETEMMRVRWRSFHFFSQIPQEQQVTVPPCPRCFAELIMHSQVLS